MDMLKRIDLGITKFIGAAAVAVTLSITSMAAQALPIGLGLIVDASGSIGTTNFDTQKAGYIAALNNVLPADGSVAVGVYRFAGSATTIFDFQIINDPTDLASLTAAINGMAYTGGSTNIPAGIDLAEAQFDNFGYANLEKAILDVSTDGFSSGNPLASAQAFVTAALATASTEGNVNCLGIGAGANCGFTAGPSAFAITGVDFATIQSSLEGKLKRELGIPEPATLAVLGVGMVGLGLVRRLKAAA